MSWDVSSGLAESYDLTQHVGELFMAVGERPNAFLRAIGGLQGAVRTIRSELFTTAVTRAVESPSQPAIKQGQDPTFEAKKTTQDTNTVQIFQEGFQLSYSAQSDQDAFAGVQVIPGSQGRAGLVNSKSPEFQEMMHLETVQNDINYSFMSGSYQAGADNTAPKTRGLENAITSNTDTNSGTGRALSKTVFEGLLKTIVKNLNAPIGGNFWAFANADQYENLIDLYTNDTQLPESRTVAGVAVDTILTKWGRVNVVFEPDVADVGNGGDSIVLARMGSIRPVAQIIVADGMTKGILFSESLAHTGSANKWQIFGKWGIDYGAEELHGRIDDLNA